MTTTQQHQDEAAPAGATPEQLGIGMRFSLHPHCDDFVEAILGALQEVRDAGLTEGLVTETDVVSTYVGASTAPAEQRLGRYLTAVLAASAQRTPTGHVVAHVLLSRGCPGEIACDPAVVGLPTPAPVEVPAAGVRAVAQWSLYPLLDAGSPAGGGSHMQLIVDAVERAEARGVASRPAHYATRLDGDLADVVSTAVDAWAAVGREVPHVVTHLTISVGSPALR